MEINAIYIMGAARKCFRLHELLAQLEERHKVDTVQCAVIRNDYTVDMRVAFSDPTTVKAEWQAMIIDDEGYGWVRFVNPTWLSYPTKIDDWIIAYKGPSALDGFDVEALQKELLVEQAAIKREICV